MNWKSLNDKVVAPLDEGELYDGYIIEVENVPDEEYDVLENIDTNMEISIGIRMPIVTKLIQVVVCIEDHSHIQLHDPLIIRSLEVMWQIKYVISLFRIPMDSKLGKVVNY